MGIFEQARNITDTSLRLVLDASDEPAEALKRHILKLEASLRDLARSEESIVRQCQWLGANVERNLKLAEASEARAAKLLELGREQPARETLRDKRESVRQVSADQRRLAPLEASLSGVRDQLQQLQRRITQAKKVRARLAAGKPLDEENLHRPPEQQSATILFLSGQATRFPGNSQSWLPGGTPDFSIAAGH